MIKVYKQGWFAVARLEEEKPSVKEFWEPSTGAAPPCMPRMPWHTLFHKCVCHRCKVPMIACPRFVIGGKNVIKISGDRQRGPSKRELKYATTVEFLFWHILDLWCRKKWLSCERERESKKVIRLLSWHIHSDVAGAATELVHYEIATLCHIILPYAKRQGTKK